MLKIEIINEISLINEGNEPAFEKLFKQYFKLLQNYAFTILNDHDTSEEIVQNVFLKIWEKREKLPKDISIKAYLYKSVYHESLNLLRHEKVKSIHRDHTLYTMKNEVNNATDRLMSNQLQQRLREALSELPQQCRTIFQMSRFDELKYKEIAYELGVSVKTVENQMGKALKLMRIKLIDFLPIIFLIIYQFYI